MTPKDTRGTDAKDSTPAPAAATTTSSAQDTTQGSEAAQRAEFNHIRYAQSWEDADILLDALDIQPGQRCLAIASAGDNALSMLSRGARVTALDLNPAQLACLELRVAAYRHLEHPELLELIGSRPSQQRPALYARCRPALGDDARRFWDAHPDDIAQGIGAAGKFERYFALFRRRILPWIHTRRRVQALLQGGDLEQRRRYYETRWNNWRWRLLFRIFFSRFLMGRLGRDPAFFRYVEGNVSQRILQRVRYGLTELDPAANPYIQWILAGTHTSALPHALRPENFDAIRNKLDQLDWHLASMEDYLAQVPARSFDGYYLSDIFEYMSADNSEQLLRRLIQAARPGARLAYWNMLVPRRRPDSLSAELQPLQAQADALFLQDKACFYSAFVVEQVSKA